MIRDVLERQQLELIEIRKELADIKQRQMELDQKIGWALHLHNEKRDYTRGEYKTGTYKRDPIVPRRVGDDDDLIPPQMFP